jgi:anthranilate synthase component 1
VIRPSLSEFLALSRKANVIPLYKEVSADLDTPVSSFLKLRKDRFSFLLESVEGQEKIARFSFLGTKPYLVFKSKGRRVEISGPGRAPETYETERDPLEELRRLMAPFRPAHVRGLPRFFGGLVGYLGYDSVRFFERLPDKNPDELSVPDSCFMLTASVLAFDHVNHTIKIISNCFLEGAASVERKKALYRQAAARIEEIEKELVRPLGSRGCRELQKPREIKITSNFEKQAFCDIVVKAKRYIRKGDIIQVLQETNFHRGHHRPHMPSRFAHQAPRLRFGRLPQRKLHDLEFFQGHPRQEIAPGSLFRLNSSGWSPAK